MRVTKFNRDIPYQYDNGVMILIKGTEYIMSDTILDGIIKTHRRLVIDSDEDFYFKNEKRRYAGEDLTGKSIVTIRNGGIGDAMFQIPALRELKKKYPTCKICVAYNAHYSFIYEGIPFIDEIKDLPLSYDVFKQYDYFVAFEGEMENMRGELENAYTIHNTCLFVNPESNIPELGTIIDDKKIAEIKKHYRFNPMDKIVVIQYRASNSIRSVDYNVWANLILDSPQGVHYVLVGANHQYPEIIDVIRQTLTIAKQKKKNIRVESFEAFTNKYESLRYAINLISISSLVIGGDSGLLHIAGALGIPLIGLYGAFPSRLRLSTYKNAIGINANSSCKYARGEFKSCFFNSSDSCKLSHKFVQKYSPCMGMINHNIVLQQMKRLKIIN